MICLCVLALQPAGGRAQNLASYVDLVGTDGASASTGNVVNLSLGSSANLINWADGTSLPGTITNNYNNMYVWSGAGANSAAGVDSATYFGIPTEKIVNLVGVYSYLSTADWWQEITFSNLSATAIYEFVGVANRNNSGYSPARTTRFTIVGADSFVYGCSSGATKLSEDSVQIDSGNNTANGYVVRWYNIQAADGAFTIRAQNFSTNPYQGYGIQGLRLVESYLPGTVVLFE